MGFQSSQEELCLEPVVSAAVFFPSPQPLSPPSSPIKRSLMKTNSTSAVAAVYDLVITHIFWLLA
jgi:hypothetical protein